MLASLFGHNERINAAPYTQITVFHGIQLGAAQTEASFVGVTQVPPFQSLLFQANLRSAAYGNRNTF